MKFVRFGARGAEKPGIMDASGAIRDLSGQVDDIAGDVLGRLAELGALAVESLPLAPADARLGACVGGIGKYICIGLNYSDHAAESGMQVPPEPLTFAKYTTAVCGPNDPIIIPRGSEKTDWEVELAFVIGTRGKYIDEADALGHVAGYFVANDVSERSFQIERAGQWSKGKSSDNFGPIGPWLVTPDAAGDIGNLAMWLDVNGTRMQTGSTATMVYKVPFLISYLSQFFTLEPGDVIATGTPPGVGMGMTPPRYLAPGDVVTLGIEGLGAQRQVCVADA